MVLPLEAYLSRKALFKSIMICHRYMSEVSDNFQSAPLGGVTGNCFRDEFNSKISISIIYQVSLVHAKHYSKTLIRNPADALTAMSCDKSYPLKIATVKTCLVWV